MNNIEFNIRLYLTGIMKTWADNRQHRPTHTTTLCIKRNDRAV